MAPRAPADRPFPFRLERIPFLRKLDQHTAEVVRGASLALFLKVVGAALSFGLNVAVARMFGPEGSGIYFIALTVMTIATVSGRMGLDNALLRFVAANASVRDWPVVRGVYLSGMAIAAVASLMSSAVMVIAAPVLAGSILNNPELAGPIRWSAVAVWPVVMLTLHGEMLRGLKRIFASTAVSAVCLPGLAIPLMALVGTRHGPVGAVWAYAGAAILTAVVGWLLWRRATPELRAVKGSLGIHALLRSSMPLLWVASMSMGMNWIATFTLGVWGTTSDVGVFNAAARAAFLVSFVLIAVNTITAPKFAELYQTGQITALARTARSSARLMVVVAAPILLLYLLFPGTIMGVFGQEFGRGAPALVVLAIGQAAGVVAGSVGYILMMSGHERQVRNSNLIAAIICVGLCIGLVPVWGPLGAAIAVGGSLLARNAVEIWMVGRYLGIGALSLTPAAPQPADEKEL